MNELTDSSIFVLNDQTLGVIEELGAHMPGGVFTVFVSDITEKKEEIDSSIADRQAALDTLSESFEKTAAVLMDIQMPVMNGYESSRAIRAMEEESGDAYFRMVPILAMSANAYDEDVRACLDAGMNAHIAKPFQPDALLKLLCELIE